MEKRKKKMKTKMEESPDKKTKEEGDQVRKHGFSGSVTKTEWESEKGERERVSPEVQ